MPIRYARRMNDLTASDIREILKVTQQKDIISFAGGLPAEEFFPAQQMAEVLNELLNSNGGKALQYSTTEGHPPLREAIARHLNEIFATAVNADEVLITSGSQQGLDLIGKVFLNEGDVVLCESPTYLGAINAFKSFRPRFVELPSDEDGVIPKEFDRAIRQNKRVKFVYVLPDFQNPTGRSWSLNRRREFLEIVNRHGIPVIEDSPYSELCFEGDPMPALKSMDTSGQVILLGTFSKILCPGLRIGWLVAEPSIFRQFVLVKQGTDLHTSTLSQYQIAGFIERFGLKEQIEQIKSVYRIRRDAMISSMERMFPKDVKFTRPMGGLFLWVELPGGINARDLLARSIENGVAFVPGGSFFANGGHENTLRLNFSSTPPDLIVEGIKRLAQALHELSKN